MDQDRVFPRWAGDFSEWRWGGEVRKHDGASGIVLHVDDLPKIAATDAQRLLRQAHHAGVDDMALLVFEFNSAYLDEDYLPVSSSCFMLQDDQLIMQVSVVLTTFEDDGTSVQSMGVALRPLLQRQHLRLVAIKLAGFVPPDSYCDVQLGARTRGRTLGELYQAGKDVEALLTAVDGGGLTRETAGDLVRGGHAHVLIGQPEGHWLDVKGQHYDLDTPHGKIALAQAVARFCNAEAGGLVVVGMSTKKVPGGEEIRGLAPVPHDGRMVRRYQHALEDRLFPPPDGLTIESVAVDEGMLVLVDIPPQPEELKPFLVHGTIVDGRVEGAFISIVRRRGESSIPITAPAIHATLAAGRALLRRGELPPSDS